MHRGEFLTVIRRHQKVRVVELSDLIESIHDARETVIDREEGFASFLCELVDPIFVLFVQVWLARC